MALGIEMEKFELTDVSSAKWCLGGIGRELVFNQKFWKVFTGPDGRFIYAVPYISDHGHIDYYLVFNNDGTEVGKFEIDKNVPAFDWMKGVLVFGDLILVVGQPLDPMISRDIAVKIDPGTHQMIGWKQEY